MWNAKKKFKKILNFSNLKSVEETIALSLDRKLEEVDGYCGTVRFLDFKVAHQIVRVPGWIAGGDNDTLNSVEDVGAGWSDDKLLKKQTILKL